MSRKIVSVSLPGSLAELYEAQAEREGVPLSHILRRALEAFVTTMPRAPAMSAPVSAATPTPALAGGALPWA